MVTDAARRKTAEAISIFTRKCLLVVVVVVIWLLPLAFAVLMVRWANASAWMYVCVVRAVPSVKTTAAAEERFRIATER